METCTPCLLQAVETFAASVDGDASERSAGAKRVSGLSMAREAAHLVNQEFIECIQVHLSTFREGETQATPGTLMEESHQDLAYFSR